MPWRTYTINQKYTKVDGTISIYKIKNKKWIKNNKLYKPQKRGFEKKSIYSKRFGFLELYNRKEQQSLVCPSGYTISQCFNVMRKLWYGYRKSLNYDKDLEKMKKYARAIQEVQEDMGILTTSFPHLDLYGDLLVLNDKKSNSIVREDHSAMKKLQEFEKRQAKNSKKIQEFILTPDKSKGESILTIADDVYPFKKIDYEESVPELLEPNEGQEESLLVMSDETPFLDEGHPKRVRKKHSQNSNHTRFSFTQNRIL